MRRRRHASEERDAIVACPRLYSHPSMFVNPKRSGAAIDELYSYYAGFSPEFVSAALDRLRLAESTTLLDPWNGAGTTTRVAARRGFAVRGFDINPVMV